MSKSDHHVFLGGTIIELTDQGITEAREYLKSHPEIENKAEVVFLVNEVVYVCDFDSFLNFIRSTSGKDW